MEPVGVNRMLFYIRFYYISVFFCVLLFNTWRFTHFNIFQCLFILYFFTNKKPLQTLGSQGFYIAILKIQYLTSINQVMITNPIN